MNKLYLLSLILVSSLNCQANKPKPNTQAKKAIKRKRTPTKITRKRVLNTQIAKKIAIETVVKKTEQTNKPATVYCFKNYHDTENNKPIFKLSHPSNPNWSIGFDITYSDNNTNSSTYPKPLNSYDYNPNSFTNSNFKKWPCSN
jgi:hypothetical protein